MSKKQDRIDIVNKIEEAAVSYKQNLVGKKFMYVFDDRYIEVIYKAENFRHLTGVDTKLSAKQFYDYARKGKLSASQIGFSPTHPYALCTRKVKHLSLVGGFVYGADEDMDMRPEDRAELAYIPDHPVSQKCSG